MYKITSLSYSKTDLTLGRYIYCELVMVLVLFLIILMMASRGEMSPPFDRYEHLIFVQSWPFGFCTTTVCNHLTTDQLEMFTIHGLWPVTSNGFMESCNDHTQKLDYKSLGETADQYLKVLWPSLSAKFERDEDFWDSEWNKHGSCTNMTFHDYFLHAIRLREKVDLFRVLEEHNIREGRSYQISAIKDAIRKNNFIGGEDRVVLQCVEMKGVYILTEVFLCVGEHGDFVACNRHVRSLENCGIAHVQFLDGGSSGSSNHKGQSWSRAASSTGYNFITFLLLLASTSYIILFSLPQSLLFL